jgi:hypothetical protein
VKRDPEWRDREGIIDTMLVTPLLIASLICRGLLNHVPGIKSNCCILKIIEDDGEGWANTDELHHNMRNALFKTRQNSAAACV